MGVHTAVDALLGVPMTAAADTPAAPGRLKVDVTVPEATTPIEISVNRSGEPSALEQWLAKAGVFAGSYFNLFALPIATGAGGLTLFIVVCGGIVALASRRININEFSLHHFYKNRLVRCFLGASHGRNRQPNPLTGFDPADDFPLSVLRSDEGDTPEACKYTGPYPIVNTTLNLNVGAELAQQERKGASFVFTPEYCGFDPPASTVDARPSWLDHFDKEGGYRRTTGGTYGYSSPEGPTIGQALAISGAAANPNSGCATTNSMAFLLTVFDARLGWWLGNPRWRKASSKPGPSFALGSLLSELFAQTNARSKYINLSDGGHFDNLGLYELVRRRCRYIIIGDGEQDGELTFGSLGGAIRKCRADFGVEIAIDPTPIRLQANGRSKVHCVVGTITYPELDEAQPAPMTQANAKDDVRRRQGGHRSGPRMDPVLEVEPHRRRARGRHRVSVAQSGVSAPEHRRPVLLGVAVRELSPPRPARGTRGVRGRHPEGGGREHVDGPARRGARRRQGQRGGRPAGDAEMPRDVAVHRHEDRLDRDLPEAHHQVVPRHPVDPRGGEPLEQRIQRHGQAARGKWTRAAPAGDAGRSRRRPAVAGHPAR